MSNNNESVGILVSPGYGAGWSSWCGPSGGVPHEFLLMDQGLIRLAEYGASEEEAEKYIKSKYPRSSVYMGGWEQIEVNELPSGTRFRVDEYHGYETLIELSPSDGYIAEVYS